MARRRLVLMVAWCVLLVLCFPLRAAGSTEAQGGTEAVMAAAMGKYMQAALLGLQGKPVQELETVDLGGKLAELSLTQWFPPEMGCLYVALRFFSCACSLLLVRHGRR